MKFASSARAWAAVGMSAVLFGAAPAFAQGAKGATDNWPQRPIRFITPAAPGGTTDQLARLFSARMTEMYGQQVIVDNRASASGVIAGELTANAAPDGYTLFLPYHQHTINAALQQPPSVPRSVMRPFRHRKACSTASPASELEPTMAPASLMSDAEPWVPPSVPITVSGMQALRPEFSPGSVPESVQAASRISALSGRR